MSADPDASPDVVIVGGGPAGAAAAILLARAGVRVRLLERTRGPHDKVCGEFVSAEAVACLHRLGVDPVRLGAVPIREIGIAGRRRAVATRLPFDAAGLSRRIMDEALLDAAAAAGARLDRGATVRALAPEGAGHRVTLAGGEEIRAGHVFVATGKHDLPGRPRPEGRQPGLIGLKMHFRLDPAADAPPHPGRVDLLPLADGYAGLQPVGDGLVNLCALVDRDRFARPAGRTGPAGWAGLLDRLRAEVPAARRLLAGATPLWPKPAAIARIPYGYVRRDAGGLWWLGDQAAVIPSFSGDGMAIALHSAERAAAAFLRGDTADAYQTALGAELRAQVGRATALSRLMVRPWFQETATLAVAAAPAIARRIALGTRIAAAMPT